MGAGPLEQGLCTSDFDHSKYGGGTTSGHQSLKKVWIGHNETQSKTWLLLPTNGSILRGLHSCAATSNEDRLSGSKGQEHLDLPPCRPRKGPGSATHVSCLPRTEALLFQLNLRIPSHERCAHTLPLSARSHRPSHAQLVVRVGEHRRTGQLIATAAPSPRLFASGSPDALRTAPNQGLAATDTRDACDEAAGNSAVSSGTSVSSLFPEFLGQLHHHQL